MPRKNGDELHRDIRDELRERQGTFVIASGDCPPEVQTYFLGEGIPCLRKGSPQLRLTFLTTLFEERA